MIAFLRQNPAMLGILVGLVIATLVGVILSFVMLRSGAPLRPLIWVYIQLGIIGGPQILFHFAQAVGWLPKVDLTWTPASTRQVPISGFREVEGVLRAEQGKFVEPQSVFGATVDPTLITDLRPMFTTALAGMAGPEVAQMGVGNDGSTTWVARFADVPTAQSAFARIAGLMGLRSAGGAKDGSWVGRRPAGDWAKVLVAGRTVFAWSAATETAVEAQAKACRALESAGEPVVKVEESGMAKAARQHWLYRMPSILTLAAVMLVASVLWFFKGLTWATRSEPTPEQAAHPASAAELERRLLALNELDGPFQAERLPDGSGVALTWRYADAKWIDLARVRGLRRIHRVVLGLDPASRSVRVTDFQTGYDWSAGKVGASFQWQFSGGITLFQIDYGRVLGLQLDGKGLAKPSLTYAYRFNLAEMKGPAQATVLQSGWIWKPVAWNAPASLRWLTE